jgi:hypothetical protein
MTEVYFLWEKPDTESNFKESVFAYFPTLDADHRGNKTAYAHIGQHSGCHPDYARECKQASFNEYCHSLLPELISVGYNDLRIMNAETFSYWRNPSHEEIKLGYGTIHHIALLLEDCINPKTGKIKKWIKAEDGLRYNYV